ncbi:MAG: hypothetical protein H8E98_00280 [Bacteroidetes bacterium]|nr:hypothetical protein [Bacteroidota bacterium]
MSYFTKKNIFLWAFIVLLVFNISAILTFYAHHQKMGRYRSDDTNENRPNPRCFIKEELNLTGDQLSQFDIMKKAHHKDSKKTRDIIFEKHNILYDEITKENPDSLIVKTMLEDIGKLHIELYSNNIKHYGDLKMICRGEQIEKLNEFYKDIMFKNRKHHQKCDAPGQLKRRYHKNK